MTEFDFATVVIYYFHNDKKSKIYPTCKEAVEAAEIIVEKISNDLSGDPPISHIAVLPHDWEDIAHELVRIDNKVQPEALEILKLGLGAEFGNWELKSGATRIGWVALDIKEN